MNKIITCIAILLLITLQTFSQQLIGTAGQQQNNVSWSIGEIVNAEGSVSGLFFSQGLYSSENFIFTDVPHVSLSTISAYPNPVLDKLYVKNSESGYYTCTITDIVGRVWINNKVDTDQEIDLSHFASGQYILKVSTSQFSKSTIIIKR
ncbi:MAG TPA: T9SS type A sorting domain-containing protein [Paludibacter sp.]